MPAEKSIHCTWKANIPVDLAVAACGDPSDDRTLKALRDIHAISTATMCELIAQWRADGSPFGAPESPSGSSGYTPTEKPTEAPQRSPQGLAGARSDTEPTYEECLACQ